jgi:hypothetical protein
MIDRFADKAPPATGIVTVLENRMNKSQAPALAANATVAPKAEDSRIKRLIDAYGDRESLERLAEVTAVYEATR